MMMAHSLDRVGQKMETEILELDEAINSAVDNLKFIEDEFLDEEERARIEKEAWEEWDSNS